MTDYKRRAIAMHAVLLERERQEDLRIAGKFRATCADDLPAVEKLTILAEEFGEVAREVCEGMHRVDRDPAKLRAELVQVAAVCVAWVEALDDGL